MKLGFLLFEYFPFGGLQRDCLKTARVCSSRGHDVFILTRTWQGEKPADVNVELFGTQGWTNQSRNRNFLRQLDFALPGYGFDAVTGFNKMPGLDVYFGADPCYVNKVLTTKPIWYRWLSRFRHYAALEKSVFAKGRSTRILQLTPHEIAHYKNIYGTEDRFHLLPPMAPRRSFDLNEQKRQRQRLRGERGLNAEDLLLLFVGSDFRRKGLDRVLQGMAALKPGLRARSHLVVLGQCAPAQFETLALRLGLRNQVHFLGGRTDAPDWMLASDLLVHPAFVETAGAVLVEALTHGLPVLTTEPCGYAFHIRQSGAGQVISEPFSMSVFQKALQDLLMSQALRSKYSSLALDYAAKEDLYGCHQAAADIIEAAARGEFGNNSRKS